MEGKYYYASRTAVSRKFPDPSMRTNPEITFYPWSIRSENAFAFNMSKDNPFSKDVRVRRAMQMALDLETMNDTYYDPEGAEKLLDEAGYPRGADGIRIKATESHFEHADFDYAQFAASYWQAIGVDVESRSAPLAAWSYWA